MAAHRRAAALAAVLAGVLTLGACTTTVTGTGTAAGGSGGGTSTADPSASESPVDTKTGPYGSDNDGHDLWDAVVEASSSTGGTVTVSGVVSGAGIGGAEITAVYSRGDDGDPIARVGIITPEDHELQLLAIGGTAWVKGPAAVYVEYGYPESVAAEADGKQVLLTDDDSGLDAYASLESFLGLCGPDPDDPASTDDDTYDGRDVSVVIDDKYGTRNYVDPAEGLILASVYDDETVTFEYTDERATVIAPNEASVVTVEGL